MLIIELSEKEKSLNETLKMANDLNAQVKDLAENLRD